MEELRKQIGGWNLGSDKQLLNYLQGFSNALVARTKSVQDDLDDLQYESQTAELALSNTFNQLLMLSNSQFLESRVYEDDTDIVAAASSGGDKKAAADGAPADSGGAGAQGDAANGGGPKEQDLVEKFTAALRLGLGALDYYNRPMEAITASTTDENGEGAPSGSVSQQGERIEPAKNDPWSKRPLPHVIGTRAFLEDDTLGLPPPETVEYMGKEKGSSESEESSSESGSESGSRSSETTSSGSEDEESGSEAEERPFGSGTEQPAAGASIPAPQAPSAPAASAVEAKAEAEKGPQDFLAQLNARLGLPPPSATKPAEKQPEKAADEQSEAGGEKDRPRLASESVAESVSVAVPADAAAQESKDARRHRKKREKKEKKDKRRHSRRSVSKSHAEEPQEESKEASDRPIFGESDDEGDLFPSGDLFGPPPSSSATLSRPNAASTDSLGALSAGSSAQASKPKKPDVFSSLFGGTGGGGNLFGDDEDDWTGFGTSSSAAPAAGAGDASQAPKQAEFKRASTADIFGGSGLGKSLFDDDEPPQQLPQQQPQQAGSKPKHSGLFGDVEEDEPPLVQPQAQPQEQGQPQEQQAHRPSIVKRNPALAALASAIDPASVLAGAVRTQTSPTAASATTAPTAATESIPASVAQQAKKPSSGLFGDAVESKPAATKPSAKVTSSLFGDDEDDVSAPVGKPAKQVTSALFGEDEVQPPAAEKTPKQKPAGARATPFAFAAAGAAAASGTDKPKPEPAKGPAESPSAADPLKIAEASNLAANMQRKMQQQAAEKEVQKATEQKKPPAASAGLFDDIDDGDLFGPISTTVNKPSSSKLQRRGVGISSSLFGDEDGGAGSITSSGLFASGGDSGDSAKPAPKTSAAAARARKAISSSLFGDDEEDESALGASSSSSSASSSKPPQPTQSETKTKTQTQSVPEKEQPAAQEVAAPSLGSSSDSGVSSLKQKLSVSFDPATMLPGAARQRAMSRTKEKAQAERSGSATLAQREPESETKHASLGDNVEASEQEKAPPSPTKGTGRLGDGIAALQHRISLTGFAPATPHERRVLEAEREEKKEREGGPDLQHVTLGRAKVAGRKPRRRPPGFVKDDSAAASEEKSAAAVATIVAAGPAPSDPLRTQAAPVAEKSVPTPITPLAQPQAAKKIEPSPSPTTAAAAKPIPSTLPAAAAVGAPAQDAQKKGGKKKFASLFGDDDDDDIFASKPAGGKKSPLLGDGGGASSNKDHITRSPHFLSAKSEVKEVVAGPAADPFDLGGSQAAVPTPKEEPAEPAAVPASSGSSGSASSSKPSRPRKSTRASLFGDDDDSGLFSSSAQGSKKSSKGAKPSKSIFDD